MKSGNMKCSSNPTLRKRACVEAESDLLGTATPAEVFVAIAVMAKPDKKGASKSDALAPPN